MTRTRTPTKSTAFSIPGPIRKANRCGLNKSATFALKAERIIRRLDPSRPVYHHSSGNLSQAYTLNCYLDFVPMQERSDWFGHWATEGVKPLLLVEYGEPYQMTFSGNRGEGRSYRPWFPTEWGAQFQGDAAYQLSDAAIGNSIKQDAAIKFAVQAAYIARNWPAFRTWGVSLFNRWEVYTGWDARRGAKNGTCKTDWETLQKPGYSPDFIRTQRWDLAYDDADWTPNVVGKALLRYNRPVLAYIAGKAEHFTGRDHNFLPGETLEKQCIVINNSRRPVTCDCSWSLQLPSTNGVVNLHGDAQVRIETGEQVRRPLKFVILPTTRPGSYQLTLTARFDTGETQNDKLTINILPAAPKPAVTAKVALFDPKGETKKLLAELGVALKSVDAGADAAGYDVLIIGKHALTMADPKLDLGRVRKGLKVVLFEQTTDVLEKRFGFRTEEYGLREVFPRAAGAELLAGLTADNLHDWRGEGTTVPPRLEAATNNPVKFPKVQWCGITASRAWRCGCQGTVASVLIEKPAAGDFLPLLDGGFATQYAPLMEYREGSGMVLFCQLDVTGRTEGDPAAARLVGNLLGYVSAWKPAPQRKLLYVGEAAGKTHLEQARFAPADYQGGPLTADQVLVAGPGSGEKLAANRKDIESWLKAGGRLLAVGLSQDEADALPLKVTMKKADYICGTYPMPAADSPWAGIAPADLFNRSPRELSLVSEGASAVGGGVLAKAEGANLVFCQLVPWQFDYQKDGSLKWTFRRSSFALARLLSNMGAAAETPLLGNMQEPLPQRAMLNDVSDAVWLETSEKQLVLPKIWKGLWIGPTDPPKDWETAAYDDSKWRDLKIAETWQNQFKDLVNVNSVFLYRVAFDVPADMAGQDVTLVLGAVDDEDWTYLNGQFVGSMTEKTNPKDYWQAIRRYKLPAGLLKPGAT